MIDGTKFERLRKNAKLSQGELAKRMGVTTPTIQRAEWEVRDLSLSMAAIAASIMGCKIEDFLKPINLS